MITDFKLFENIDDFSKWKKGDSIYYIGTDGVFKYGSKLTIEATLKTVKIKHGTFRSTLQLDDNIYLQFNKIYYSIMGLIKDEGLIKDKPRYEQRFTKDIRKIYQNRFDL